MQFIDRAGQLFDFSKLNTRWGKMGTDIDYSSDYLGRIFVFGDFKYGDVPVKDGQRRHYQYKVDAIKTQTERGLVFDACAFIARHTVDDRIVDGRQTNVVEYYRGADWISYDNPIPFERWLSKAFTVMNREIIEPF